MQTANTDEYLKTDYTITYAGLSGPKGSTSGIFTYTTSGRHKTTLYGLLVHSWRGHNPGYPSVIFSRRPQLQDARTVTVLFELSDLMRSRPNRSNSVQLMRLSVNSTRASFVLRRRSSSTSGRLLSSIWSVYSAVYAIGRKICYLPGLKCLCSPEAATVVMKRFGSSWRRAKKCQMQSRCCTREREAARLKKKVVLSSSPDCG